MRLSAADVRSCLAAITLLTVSLADFNQTAWSQTAVQDEPAEFETYLRRPAGSRYHVVALRVEFQPDTSRFTTGDGRFGSQLFGGLSPRIDPFPHDEAYFGAHLEFLRNYVGEVSGGKTDVVIHQVPSVVQVSQQMPAYSPIGLNSDSPAEVAKLASLVREAWMIADNEIEFDVSDIDPDAVMFVLFHAGTGRDVELTGTTLDRTPEDLPSLFFDRGRLDDFLDAPIIFKGLTVTNAAVLPETESKRGVNPITDEPFLLELSINGLLAASFFNFLGVPDLFDTSTGTSAIGPYGLMDPLGIFAYGGLLPPEPSAWTKYYLGWTEPVELSGPDEQTASLNPRRDAAIVPVSSGEFFLAETRHRDPAGDGLNLKVLRNGEVVEQRFDHGTADFTATSQSGFKGVLMGADDYDWVLPGGFDDEGTLRLGGVLIWHVQDDRIRAGLPRNTVNNDPNRRAVDLEEADSAPDLGFPNTNPFAPDFDRGTPFDFFFEGNPITSITATGQVTLYENRFGPDTYPNSNTSAGGPSFVTLLDFSPVDTVMTLTYRRTSGTTISPLPLFDGQRLASGFGEGSSLSSFRMEIGPAVRPVLLAYNPSADSLWMIPEDGDPLSVSNVVSAPAVVSTTAGDRAAYVTDEDEILRLALLGPGFPRQTLVDLPAAVQQSSLATALLGSVAEGEATFFAGFNSDGLGQVLRTTGPDDLEVLPFGGGSIRALSVTPGGRLVVIGREKTEVWIDGVLESEIRYSDPLTGSLRHAVAALDREGLLVAGVEEESDAIVLISEDGTVFRGAAGPTLSPPVPVDLDRDGLVEVVTVAGSRLLAFTRTGSLLSGFPIALPAGSRTRPLTYTTSDSLSGLIVTVDDGHVYSWIYSERKLLPQNGFPLAFGGEALVTPLLTEGRLVTLSADGIPSGWEFATSINPVWSTLFANRSNANFVEIAADAGNPPASEALLDGDGTYNWPNPVTGGETRLRVTASEPCEVDVTVVDMSGSVVWETELTVPFSGVPVEAVWNPTASSGLYFARVQARTTNGRTDTRLIRIAIIR